MAAFVPAGSSLGSAVGAHRRPALVVRGRPGAAGAVGGGARRSIPMTMGGNTRIVDGVERRRVVVTGMGVASVFGTDVDEYYDKLLAGESGIKAIDGFDCEGGDALCRRNRQGRRRLAGYVSPKARGGWTRSLSYALVAGQKALESAGLSKATPRLRHWTGQVRRAVRSLGMGGVS
eukprot:contig_28914_g7109